jgi:hypothetical protein
MHPSLAHRYGLRTVTRPRSNHALCGPAAGKRHELGRIGELAECDHLAVADGENVHSFGHHGTAGLAQLPGIAAENEYAMVSRVLLIQSGDRPER